METNSNIPTLLVKHLQNTLTDTEKQELDQWVMASAENRQLFDRFCQPLSPGDAAALDEGDERAEWDEIVSDSKPAPVYRMRWQWRRVVAVLVVISGICVLYLVLRQSNSPVPVAVKRPSLALPGNSIRYKAFLKGINGKEIDLDKIAKGVIADHDGLQIIKTNSHCIEYRIDQRADLKYDPTVLHTISTPQDGQWKVILPDRSSAWLNKGTSITFSPGNLHERSVTLAGEAYFDVIPMWNGDKPKKFPFTVFFNDNNRVEVMGTSFNVRAYANEETTKTALIEGRIKLITPGTSHILKPGEEAQLNKKNQLSVTNADVNAVTTWTTGEINFVSCSLDSIMRIVKWYYNVELECSRRCNERYNATLQFHQPVSSFFAGLDSTYEIDVEFDGKKILVK